MKTYEFLSLDPTSRKMEEYIPCTVLSARIPDPTGAVGGMGYQIKFNEKVIWTHESRIKEKEVDTNGKSSGSPTKGKGSKV